MYNGQKVGAIIVAAGSSRRMGGADKISMMISGKPLLVRVIDVFKYSPLIDEIIVVLNENNIDTGRKMAGKGSNNVLIKCCTGGARRQDSVAAGLSQIESRGWVVIHDGARPLVDGSLIERGLAAAWETGAAVAAVPVTDTIKEAGEDNMVTLTLPRQRLWAVQTPQVFRYDIIKAAHAWEASEVTDDAALAEQSGYKVKIYSGSYDNIKITTLEDLAMVEYLLKKRQAGNKPQTGSY